MPFLGLVNGGTLADECSVPHDLLSQFLMHGRINFMHTAAEHSDGATTTIKRPAMRGRIDTPSQTAYDVSPALASTAQTSQLGCGRNSTRHAYRRWLSPSHRPPSIGRAHTKRWEGRATRAAISGSGDQRATEYRCHLVTLIDYFVRQFNAFGGPQTTRQRNAHAFDFAEFVGRSLKTACGVSK